MSSLSFAQNSVGKDARKNATQMSGPMLARSVVVHSSPQISEQKRDYSQSGEALA